VLFVGGHVQSVKGSPLSPETAYATFNAAAVGKWFEN